MEESRTPVDTVQPGQQVQYFQPNIHWTIANLKKLTARTEPVADGLVYWCS